MEGSLNVDGFDKSLLFSIRFQIFTRKLVHRKGWGTSRFPKSCNLSLDCPPRLVLFKMADKIPMSQRALPKVTSQRYISSQRCIPNNVKAGFHMIADDRGSRIADRRKFCDRLRSYGNTLLRSPAILRS